MSSTNKTTNYNLSQYVGSDKPTYLGDYNSDMSKIDTQMKNNNTLAESALDLATEADDKADTAQAAAETADGKATTAGSTATNALEKATQNQSDIAKFNLTEFEDFTYDNMIISGATLGSGANIHVASNSDGTIGKIYGTIPVSQATDEEALITISGSNLRPESEISISGIAINYILYDLTGGSQSVVPYLRSVTIKPNGDIVFSLNESLNGKSKLIVTAALLFLKDFGDTSSSI